MFRLGIETASIDEVKGGTPGDNAEMLRGVLNGQKGPGRDIVVMNAAAALVASNMATDFTTGIHMAGEAIDSGRALGKMEDLIKLSQKLARD